MRALCVLVASSSLPPLVSNMQPEDPEAKRLLKECMKRGIESIERSTTMSTRQAQSLYDSASESDKRVLKDMYVKSMFVTMGTASVAALAMVRLTSSRMLWGLTGLSFGISAAALNAAYRMPFALLEMAQGSTPSAIADEIVCPAVREFEPCVDDPKCHALMSTGARRAQTLLSCVDACRARAALLRGTTAAAAAAAAPAMGELSDGSIMAHEEPNPGGDEQSAAASQQRQSHQAVTDRLVPPHLHKAPDNSSQWKAGGANSWEEVRARHRARQMGQEPQEQEVTAVAESVSDSVNEVVAAPPPRRKNAYGDEVLE